MTDLGPLWRVWWTDVRTGKDDVLWTHDPAEAEAKADEVKATPHLTLQAWDNDADVTDEEGL